MRRRRFINGLIAVLGVGTLSALCATQLHHRQPNFIVILCDDLGYGDIQPFGGSIPTPAINRMAREGLVATDYYAAANLCTPSRAGLLTGRYAIRAGLAYQVIMSGDERRRPTSARARPHVFAPFYGLPYSHDMLPLAIYEADAKTGSVTTTPADYPTLQENFYSDA